MIKSVKGLKIGGTIEYEGNLFTITKFPTRNMVCADIIKYKSGRPSHIKIPISNYIKTYKSGDNTITIGHIYER